MRWLLLLLLLPLIEISVFMDVGAAIGVGATLLLTLGSAIWGITMVRLQGMDTWQRMQQTMANGETPAFEMFEGALLLLAGMLLLIPGFVTDSFGIILLIPPLRKHLALKMFNKPESFQFKVHSHQINPNNFDNDSNNESKNGRTIDQKEPWE